MMRKGTLLPARRVFRHIALAAGLTAVAGAVAAEGFFVVQIAAVKSEARANEEWGRLKNRHAELLGDMFLNLRRVDLAERGIFYRMQIGPFPNRTTALDMCGQLKAVKMDCIVAEAP